MFFKPSPIAIDIGSSAIKIVELNTNEDRSLKNMGMELLPQGAIVDGFIQDISTVKSVLKRLVRRLRISTRGRRASISLGGSSIIVKRAIFPNKDELELADLIEAEAEQHFQHDINDLFFTWHADEASSNQLERSVILVGAKRDLVEQHIAATKSVGLRIGVIECDVFSTFNMFEYSFGTMPGLFALVNIGASSVQVSMIGHGHYLYTRDVSIGGNNYTKTIASALSLSWENAEALKIATSQGDKSVNPQVIDLINQMNRQLASEIQVTIDFFMQSGDSPRDLSSLSGAFLSGGGARALGLDSLLSGSMNIPVNIINPFHKIDMPGKYANQSIMSQSNLYGVAVGLGLRQMETLY